MKGLKVGLGGRGMGEEGAGGGGGGGWRKRNC